MRGQTKKPQPKSAKDTPPKDTNNLKRKRKDESTPEINRKKKKQNK